MPTITRRLEIDAGHRLLRHESKCRNAHGHRYVFDITVSGRKDKVGRIIDFSRVKELVGVWLDTNWDHGFIVQRGDPLIQTLRQIDSKMFVVDWPPTAENMSQYLHKIASALLHRSGIRVRNVRCWETPNCWADSA